MSSDWARCEFKGCWSVWFLSLIMWLEKTCLSHVVFWSKLNLLWFRMVSWIFLHGKPLVKTCQKNHLDFQSWLPVMFLSKLLELSLSFVLKLNLLVVCVLLIMEWPQNLHWLSVTCLCECCIVSTVCGLDLRLWSWEFSLWFILYYLLFPGINKDSKYERKFTTY